MAAKDGNVAAQALGAVPLPVSAARGEIIPGFE